MPYRFKRYLPIIICEVSIMKNEYTAVVKQEGEWWVGWIEEVPGINCQENMQRSWCKTLIIDLVGIYLPRNFINDRGWNSTLRFPFSQSFS